MDYFKPETNLAETVALRFPTGKPCQSKITNEDQVMFSLVDGRVWYAPPFVASKVESLGLQPFENFIVCKREVKLGNRKSIDWQIGRVVESEAAPMASIPNGAPSNPPPTTEAKPSPSSNGSSVPAPVNGNGRTIPTIEDAAAKLLERTGKMALDAVLEVERYAREVRQLEGFTFGPANVQSIWCTLFINATRNGGR